MTNFRGTKDAKWRPAKAAARTVVPSEAYEPNPVIFDAEGQGFHLRTNPFVAPVDEQ